MKRVQPGTKRKILALKIEWTTDKKQKILDAGEVAHLFLGNLRNRSPPFGHEGFLFVIRGSVRIERIGRIEILDEKRILYFRRRMEQEDRLVSRSEGWIMAYADLGNCGSFCLNPQSLEAKCRHTSSA